MPMFKRFNTAVLNVARSALWLVLISMACALVVTYVIRLGSTLWQSMVFSVCVGAATMLLIRGGYGLIWGERKPSKIGFGALIAIATPLAFMIGSSGAAWMLGLPVENFGWNHLHANAAIVILTVLASIFSTWFFWTQARLERMKAETAAIEQQAMRARLQMLQAQIEPHMLFNTLANLQGLIAIDPPRAQRLLDQLIHYLRATLSSSRTEATTLANEFALMQAYLEVMAVRMGKRLTFSLDLPVELRDTVLPPMLLQPLVENAIKHGLEPNVAGGTVHVTARVSGAALILSVRDTGCGFDPAAEAGNTQLGNANVRDRLQVLYGDAATFVLSPHPAGGTLAQLSLPHPS